MRSIQLKVAITDENQIASIENAIGLPQNEVESHLLIIGILENLKHQHQKKLNTLFEQTQKK